MISKNKLKELSKYKNGKFCDQDDVFVVEGSKMGVEALMSDFEITTICIQNARKPQEKPVK